jgi:hypothetical protein
MKVRIFKPAKSAMQSGRARTEEWVLEYETETPRRPEPLMGWISSGDTLNQVRMHFASREAAVAFAESKGWKTDIDEPKMRVIRPRNYIDNFKYHPFEDDK